MDNSSRRLLDDLDEGDRVLVTLVDGQHLFGMYDCFSRDDCGVWSLVLTDSDPRLVKDGSHYPAVIVDMTAIGAITRP